MRNPGPAIAGSYTVIAWILRRLHRHCAVIVALALAGAASSLAGCGGDGQAGTTGPGGAVVRFTVKNELQAPVTVAIDDSVSLILLGGASSGLAASPRAQWLSWTSAKPTDSAGTPIPDDIGRVLVRVSGIQSVLDITNVINDTTYVTANVFNETPARVAVGVFDGHSVACASVLRGMLGSAVGFTKTGYYRLLPATEFRAYRNDDCSGPYLAWPASQLADFIPKTGLVTLVLTTAP